MEDNNRQLRTFILITGLITLLLACAVFFVYRQQRKVSKTKDSLSELNEKLKSLNQQLSRANESRERYVGLFMHLCAAYIEKLNRFPTVLK